MANLKLWAHGPFEMILHAEQHYQLGEDLDRRIALIGFDNAVEVSISTYLSLNPIHRGGLKLKPELVKDWMGSYSKKLDFFYDEILKPKGLPEQHAKENILWYHDQRNEQYHEGRPSVPGKLALDGIRNVAFWIFSTLYDEPNFLEILREELELLQGVKDIPTRTDEQDKIIDNACDMLRIGQSLYYASDLLYNFDPIAYRDLAVAIEADEEAIDE